MRSLALLALALVLSSNLFAQTREEMLRLLSEATSVTILDDRPSRSKTLQKTSVVLTSREDLRTFHDVVQLSEKPLRGEKRIFNGEEIVLTDYCQCFSDFTVIIKKDEAEVLRFGIQHWSHTRIKKGDDIIEYDFVPSSVSGLKNIWHAIS